MRFLRVSILWAVLGGIVGLVVLLGYFFPIQVIQSIRIEFLRWGVLLAAAALLVGLINLIGVHWRKLSQTEEGWIYSAVLLVTLFGTFGAAVALRPDSPIALFLFEHIQLPVEASLMALLGVTLLIAGFKLVARRRDIFSLIFVATALLILLGTAPWLGASEPDALGGLRNLKALFTQVFAAGGARGILLGVALGATTTGLRVLLGADRPYGA